jgi:hypothetical protein
MADRLAETERFGIGVILAYIDNKPFDANLLRDQAKDEGIDLEGFFLGLVLGATRDGVFDAGEWRKLAYKRAGE